MVIFKKINKKIVLIGVLTIVLAIGAATYIGFPSKSDSFTYQGEKYECGQRISGRSTLRGFKPSDQQEFDKFCRMYEGFLGVPEECLGSNVPNYCHTIEYRAVLDILGRDDIAKIVEKYDTTQVSVRALGHKYIYDKDYLHRILPAYSNMKIDCIVVVHSPEGTRFFIENGEKHESHHDHQYLEVSSEEFLTSLNKAPDVDVTNFWLGLH